MTLTNASNLATATTPLTDYGVEALTETEFKTVQKVIRAFTGIHMTDAKRQLVVRRLNGRMKATQCSTVAEYLRRLDSGDQAEIEQFTNAVTTNLTSFFRENHHFDFLRETIIPHCIARKATTTKRLRIWSAGCSTGEEPYSLAMTVRGMSSQLRDWDIKILCTDIDSAVVAKAAAGRYNEERAEKVPEPLRKKMFSQSGNQLVVRDDLRKLVTFKQLNLMGDWPMHGKFDAIFCRNVFIYFDKPTQAALVNRYADLLEEDGFLIIGHSENLLKVTDRFSLIGKTIYRREY
ncbi:MAG: protein-glutamate O-methyltransferase [Pseudomonadota bacterium]